MQLTASDFYTYHRPSFCALRVYKRHHGEEETPPGPYDEVIRELGERHEAAHVATLPGAISLADGPRAGREQRTQDAVANHTPAIYQAALRATVALDGIECEVVGDPDFLIAAEGGYLCGGPTKLDRKPCAVSGTLLGSR